MVEKPKTVNSAAQKELNKVEKQFQEFDNQVKELTLDRMNMAPKEEAEPQTKMAQVDIEKSKDIYLKPIRSIGPGINPFTKEREKFNDKFRAAYEYDKEMVYFTAENKEVIGEDIEIWTKPYAGTNTEFWRVPVNKPVWGPRYLAEQIKRKFYHRLQTENQMVGSDRTGSSYYGTLVVDKTVQRLDAIPVSKRKSIFMGSTTF